MKIRTTASVLIVSCSAIGHVALARMQSPPPAPDISVAAPDEAVPAQRQMPNVAVSLDQLKWTRMPDGTGRESADLFGDRTKPELFGYLVKWPRNTVAKAHSHPEDRHAIVLSGTFYHGHGRRFDTGALERRSQGTYFTEPAGDPHFGATRDQETVLYFVGIGPDRTDQIEK